ncbi:hypothetical protein DITRI_Ditri16bG0121400 [Diplodiscus trichospermus]
MDKHIELYLKFEGFKVLAKNYPGIKSHDLFDRADVAENLMPKTTKEYDETCLIQALRTAMEEARKKGF